VEFVLAVPYGTDSPSEVGKEMRNVKDYVRDKERALDRMGIVARWGEAMMKWE
jgi:hypothetical protein